MAILCMGCSAPKVNSWGHASTPEDIALITHWTNELESGQITISEFKFLVINRVEDMK